MIVCAYHVSLGPNQKPCDFQCFHEPIRHHHALVELFYNQANSNQILTYTNFSSWNQTGVLPIWYQNRSGSDVYLFDNGLDSALFSRHTQQFQTPVGYYYDPSFYLSETSGNVWKMVPLLNTLPWSLFEMIFENEYTSISRKKEM